MAEPRPPFPPPAPGDVTLSGRRKKTWKRRVATAMRPERLRHTWVHRLIGERLFDRHLWVPDRHGLAMGLAIGALIAVIPAFGIHIPLAILGAMVLRVNLPAALAACWIVNPITAPFIFTGLYKLGVLLAGEPDALAFVGFPAWLAVMLRHGQRLWLGSLVGGVAIALLIYAIAYFAWPWLGRLYPFHRRQESLRRRALVAVGPEREDADSQNDDDTDTDESGSPGAKSARTGTD